MVSERAIAMDGLGGGMDGLGDRTGQDIPEQLLRLALGAGAEAAEVYQSQSRSHPVYFEANRLKQLESTESSGVALRLWKDGRPGVAVGEGPVPLQGLVDRAIALSGLNEPEAVELTAGRGLQRYPSVGTAMGVEPLMEVGRSAIAQVRERFPEVLCSAEWDCGVETTRLVNSLGLDCRHGETTLTCFLAAEWVRGDDFLMVEDGQIGRDRLDGDRVAREVLQRLEWAQQTATPQSGRIPVLFTAKAAEILWGTVQSALNGKQVVEGASPWAGSGTPAGTGYSEGEYLAASRLGEGVMAQNLTLSQVPTEGPFSCPFDDEGTPTQPLVFVENGVLRNFYCDRKIGRQLGQGSTGNGFRSGLGSYPTPGLFNFSVQPGTGSLLELIKTLDRGLVVDQVLGSGAGLSGEFSINVDLGYWVEGGQIVGRVKDTMVAGNVYHALKQGVILGGDGAWNGSCWTPSVIVEGLSVTG